MDNRKIYVKHLPSSYDENHLKQLFSTCGKITEVNYPHDRKTNKPKGYAFISFENSDCARKAVEKNNEVIQGNTLIVEFANEKPTKTQAKNQ